MDDTNVERSLRRDQLATAFEHALSHLPSLSPAEVSAIAQVASSTSERARAPRLFWPTPRRLVVAVAILAMVFSTPLLAGLNPLEEIAQLTGIREKLPSVPAERYEPADVPYVSVQPLMRYVGSSLPVVPAAAVATRDREDVVFAVARPDYQGQYVQLQVEARPVSLGQRIGNAVIVSAGLTPCDRVVVAPPLTLDAGDRIRSYAEETAEGPDIDYNVLFGGRPKAPTSPLEGGVASQDRDQVVIGITYAGDPPPLGARYVYRAPDGTEQQVSYKPIVNVRVRQGVLRQGQPVGSVTLYTASGEVLAEGMLDWYCTT